MSVAPTTRSASSRGTTPRSSFGNPPPSVSSRLARPNETITRLKAQNAKLAGDVSSMTIRVQTARRAQREAEEHVSQLCLQIGKLQSALKKEEDKVHSLNLQNMSLEYKVERLVSSERVLLDEVSHYRKQLAQLGPSGRVEGWVEKARVMEYERVSEMGEGTLAMGEDRDGDEEVALGQSLSTVKPAAGGILLKEFLLKKQMEEKIAMAEMGRWMSFDCQDEETQETEDEVEAEGTNKAENIDEVDQEYQRQESEMMSIIDEAEEDQAVYSRRGGHGLSLSPLLRAPAIAGNSPRFIASRSPLAPVRVNATADRSKPADNEKNMSKGDERKLPILDPFLTLPSAMRAGLPSTEPHPDPPSQAPATPLPAHKSQKSCLQKHKVYVTPKGSPFVRRVNDPRRVVFAANAHVRMFQMHPKEPRAKAGVIPWADKNDLKELAGMIAATRSNTLALLAKRSEGSSVDEDDDADSDPLATP